jgi:HEAT repeat protein
MHVGAKLLSSILASVLVSAFLPAGEARADAEDEKIVAAAGIAAETPALLDLLRSRTLTAPKQEQIRTLIRQLGLRSYQARKKAGTALVKIGQVTLPFLTEASRGRDPEIRLRAEECAKMIRERSDPFLVAAAVRILAGRNEPATAEALIDFLPFAGHSAIEDDVRAALIRVAVRDGKAAPALRKALADGSSLKRASAAEALCSAGATTELAGVRKLLVDEDRTVRLRAAVALVRVRDKTAVPVLIDLLGELKPEEVWPAHHLLCQLARDRSPDVALGKDEAARRKCRSAWAVWWREHGAQVDLALLDGPVHLRGFTLVVLLDAGKVLEMRPDGRQRWLIEKIRQPLDAQVLPGQRILIAEDGMQRVTERDRTGKVIWEVKVREPVAAQRLANGNTFIASRGHLIEVDKKGEEVFSFTVPGSRFVTARKFPGGRIAYIMDGRCIVIDADSHEIAAFPVGRATTTGCLDILPSGHVLVAQYLASKVAEYDLSGRKLWEFRVKKPIGAAGLPNGNVLVASQAAPQVLEIDRSGKVVWQQTMKGHPTRASRR